MFGDLDKYLMVFLTGLVVTYLLTPAVRALACRYGVVDKPNARRPHQHPTARGGGVAVVIGVHAACLMALFIPGFTRPGGFDLHWWLGFAPSSLILLVVGLVDDIRGLRAWTKLAGQVLAALLISLSGTHFGKLFGFNLPPVLDGILVVVWIVAVINAFNLIDGLDGLASGLGIISATGLCGILILGHLSGSLVVLLALIGACLAFLRYNFHPATIFLGDTGSMFIGFVLSVISLQTFTKNTFFLSLTIPVLVLGVPIYDALLAIWRRTIRLWSDDTGVGPGHGIMKPDLDHLHHRLIQSGLSTRRVATILFVTNAGLAVFGLLMATFKSYAMGIFLLALLAAVYVLLRHLAIIELRETGRALLKGLRRPSHATLKALAYPVWDMFWMCGSLAFVMWELEGEHVGFWYAWFLDLPIWVTPTFSLLALSRTYVTYWPRARLRDVLMVMFWLQMGLLMSLGLALLMNPDAATKWLLRTVFIAGISHPVIVTSRLIYRCIEELVTWIRRQGESADAIERVLLFGAGVRAQLFLKDNAIKNATNFDGRTIIGFIDEATYLHHQWVYGQLVLGALEELPQLIVRHRISQIIIVADLQPDSREAVKRISSQSGIRLSEWSAQENEVELLPLPETTEDLESMSHRGS